MLQKLHIQNYAIIDEIEIDFSGKLNIITGETGAGKSILMGALSLILGDRADSAVLLNRNKKCIVEGYFKTANKKNVQHFFAANDLDSEDELVIRREIGTNGKSRAFVNDTPVNLDQLRQLSAMLVDLHQQFDTLALGETDFQREVLDALAGNASLLQQYQTNYYNWHQSGKTLQALLEQKKQFTSVYDYNKFLYDELEEAAFKENELEDLDSELKLLSNAEGIKGALSAVSNELNEGEEPLAQRVKRMLQQLQGYSSYHTALPDLLQRLQSAQIELTDIADEMERINDHVQYDPKRIEQISDRIAVGYKLLKKHNAKDTAELLQVQSQLSDKLQAVLNIDEAIAVKEKETQALFVSAQEMATQLSKNRKKQTKPLEEKVNALLLQVGMPNARLRAEMQAVSLLNQYGTDKIDFLFDANKSNRFEPIRKVASGGELSRLMLCIKSLVAQSLDLPTLIFDEIDTGISGEAAKQVGIIMKALAVQRQVISITHQPQIAGKADAHFFVYKEIKGDAIKTNIRLLTKDERITAIASMLSGEKPTAAALENAREMLMN
ncbi:MAG TPA: DNA repair protein RecN [Chitinophagaceae bacterium]|jgi:DNA repair protein RecN (Recombination protein N)|nr:DNA repair protein RecN [Chitinophagaceae bacterium]